LLFGEVIYKIDKRIKRWRIEEEAACKEFDFKVQLSANASSKT
jgi:hypothetical protein